MINLTMEIRSGLDMVVAVGKPSLQMNPPTPSVSPAPTAGIPEPELYGVSGAAAVIEPVSTDITTLHAWESGTMKTAENVWLESTTRLTAKTAQPIGGISMTIVATDTAGTVLDFAPHFNDAEGNFISNPSWTAAGTMLGIPAGAASIYICLRRPDDSEILPDALASVILREVK